MSDDRVVKGWGWVLVLLLVGMLVAPMLGCKPGIDAINITKAAGYQAPADFTRGVGETRFFQSTDGKTVYWEIPFYNDTKTMMFCSTSPIVNVREADTIVDGKVTAGKIVWTGKDFKEWSIKPGEQGRVGGKIQIPDTALRPTLHWEQGGVTSNEFKGKVE
jgi:hypothetical protein